MGSQAAIRSDVKLFNRHGERKREKIVVRRKMVIRNKGLGRAPSEYQIRKQ